MVSAIVTVTIQRKTGLVKVKGNVCDEDLLRGKVRLVGGKVYHSLGKAWRQVAREIAARETGRALGRREKVEYRNKDQLDLRRENIAVLAVGGRKAQTPQLEAKRETWVVAVEVEDGRYVVREVGSEKEESEFRWEMSRAGYAWSS